MDLFIINRYTGEDQYNEEQNEEHLRKKLLRRIKKRKRLAELEEQNNFQHKKRKECKSDNLVENKVLDLSENVSPTKDLSNVPENECISFLDVPGDSELSDKEIKKKKKDKKSKSKSNAADDNEVISRETNNEEIKDEQESGFRILGNIHISKKEKVKRKLPNWLANPSVVSVDLKNLTSPVDSIPELDKVFVNILKENGITHFFPVQSQIIPWLLKSAERPRIYWPNDICVSAPTGSGKTLAFVLPLLQILHKRIVPKIRALVVLPVQDLANQVFSVFQTYSKPTDLKVLLLSKKRPFTEEQSLICKNDGLGNYRTMVDIIVTTPGRLVDHLTKTKGLCLENLTYLIIDEADRVMENVQNDWLYHLNKHINTSCNRSYQVPIISYNIITSQKKPPNKLLFSATLSQDPEKLQQLGLFQPKLFTSVVKNAVSDENDNKDETKFIGKYTTPAELTEYYVKTTKANKPLILHHLLNLKAWKNVLCFVNSAEASSRLAFVLKAMSQGKIKIDNLSSSLTIKKRNAILKKFSNNEINVLVSTDALARGIDISNVQYVISYDAPKFIKTYIHRIGRTGRAGKEGTSIVLLTKKEKNYFKKMIQTAGKTSVQKLKISKKELQEYQSSYEEALKSLGTSLEKKKQRDLLKLKINKKQQIQAAKGKFVLKNRKSYLKKSTAKRKIKDS